MTKAYKFPLDIASVRVSYLEPGNTNYRISPEMIERIDREVKAILKSPDFWEEANKELKDSA